MVKNNERTEVRIGTAATYDIQVVQMVHNNNNIPRKKRMNTKKKKKEDEEWGEIRGKRG